MRKYTYILLLMFAAIAAGCSADGNALGGAADDDSSGEYREVPVDFYRQCRDIRCDFLLAEGDGLAHGVGTWHRNDTGILLEGNPVELVARDEYAGDPRNDVECYRFRIFGAWEEDVHMEVEFRVIPLLEVPPDSDTNTDTDSDTLGSYSIDFSGLPEPEYEPGDEVFSETVVLPNREWDVTEIGVRAPEGRAHMEFRLRKEGEGDVLLYYVEVDGDPTCRGHELRID